MCRTGRVFFRCGEALLFICGTLSSKAVSKLRSQTILCCARAAFEAREENLQPQEAIAMENSQVRSRIEETISRYDLLKHPFYQAWTAGELTTEDLRRYAQEYYHHVAAFPTYLSALHSRLADGPLRRSVLQNLCEEEIGGTAHSDLWLDFAEGMGAARDEVRQSYPSSSTRELIGTFRGIAAQSSPLAAMGAFYAYESQVARIAPLKAQGLKDHYAADAKTSYYFALHASQDVHHARVWADRIEEGVRNGETSLDEVLPAVEQAAEALWNSLSGIHQAGGATVSCSAH
jgi:pyrroloquinoline-quinone synthase